jgi:hypothetical protein
MKIQIETQYIIMTFALHYRAMTHSNIYCIRIYSNVLEVQEPYVPDLHHMAVKSEPPTLLPLH